MLLSLLVAGVMLMDGTTALVPNKSIPLVFSYITSLTAPGGFLARDSIPVVDMALEMINNRTDILTKYSLNYTTVLDSKVKIKHSPLACFYL